MEIKMIIQVVRSTGLIIPKPIYPPEMYLYSRMELTLVFLFMTFSVYRGWVNQKQEPLPKSEVTPICPPNCLIIP